MGDSRVVVTATVPKKHTEVWAGKGEVVSFYLETGVVILRMLTGEREGECGGFPIECVKFHARRS